MRCLFPLLVIVLCTSSVQAQHGACNAPAVSQALEAAGIHARIYNNGALFRAYLSGDPPEDDGAVVHVPADEGKRLSASTSLWVGGYVDDSLHFAGSMYGPYEFWPGPLHTGGDPPADCSAYNRMYRITRHDPLGDHLEWPVGLGAPTYDSTGRLIDLSSISDGERMSRTLRPSEGERPAVFGDRMIWWVMNDAGNVHASSMTSPVGLEIRGAAFAYDTPSELRHVVFLRYELVYRGSSPLTDARIALMSDIDIDDPLDYVGTDTTLDLAYFYNPWDLQEESGPEYYGRRAPAVGIGVLMGPLVASDAVDNDLDGKVDEPDERQGMSASVVFEEGSCVTCTPTTGEEMYDYTRARWRDGQRINLGGGRGFHIPTNHMYPGDPVKREF